MPVWFAYRQGRIYLLHCSDPEAGATDPGLPDAPELVVVTRRKGRDTRADRFHAAVRLIEPDNPEFEGLAALLADQARPPRATRGGHQAVAVGLSDRGGDAGGPDLSVRQVEPPPS